MKKSTYFYSAIVLILVILIVSLCGFSQKAHASEGGSYSGIYVLNGYTVNVIGSADWGWVNGALWLAIANGGYYACSNGVSALRIISGPPHLTPPPPPPPPPVCPQYGFCQGDNVILAAADCNYYYINTCAYGCANGSCLPAPTCPVSNFCQGNSVYVTTSDCNNSFVAACPYGCSNGSCLPCPEGSACTSSTYNACGENNGTFSCATNSCLPPTDDDCPADLCSNIAGNQTTVPAGDVIDSYGNCVPASNQTCPDGTIKPTNGICPSAGTGGGGLCPDGSNPLAGGNCAGTVCTGPDGVKINSGQSRTYYDPQTCSSATRTCYNGELGGKSNFTGGSCQTGAGAAPIISSFNMNPDTVNLNNDCVMNWVTSGATVCTITGPNFGTQGHNAVVPSGSAKTADITQTSVYTLTCSNDSGKATKTTACYLNPATKEN